MNEPQEQFENIAALLRLKRHEQPPPGSLDRLPGQIRARIEVEEARRDENVSWFRWFVESPGRLAFAVGACSALLMAASLMMPDEGQPVAMPLAGTDPSSALAMPGVESSPTPLGVPATKLIAGGDAQNPLTPVMIAPDAAPAGLFSPDGFLTNNSGPVRVSDGFPLPR